MSSSWTDSEQNLDSLTGYQEDPVPELVMFEEKREVADSMFDSASDKTLSRYSSLSDVSLMYDLENLGGSFEGSKDTLYPPSPDSGGFSETGDITNNNEEYQPKISSPRNYRKFLKLVHDITDQRKDLYRPESVMSDALSSLNIELDQEWKEQWMKDAEEVCERIQSIKEGNKNYQVSSNENTSSDEDQANNSSRNVTPTPSKHDKSPEDDLKYKKRRNNNNNRGRSSPLKLFDVGSGYAGVNQYMNTINKSCYYGTPLINPQYYICQPAYTPVNLRPGLMGQYNPSYLANRRYFAPIQPSYPLAAYKPNLNYNQRYNNYYAGTNYVRGGYDTSKRPVMNPRTMLQKPATQLLMEVHKSALTYVCVKEEGPVHDRSYTMSVHVKGREFTGKAKSKKHAKWVAAAEALKHLYNININDPSNSDKANRGRNVNKSYHVDMPPVMLLNLLTNSALEYRCVGQDGPVHERIFTMKVTVKGREFYGQGWNKRSAKASAARQALLELFRVNH